MRIRALSNARERHTVHFPIQQHSQTPGILFLQRDIGMRVRAANRGKRHSFERNGKLRGRNTQTHTLVLHSAVQYTQWVYTWSICQSNLQVLQRKLQHNPGPDIYTRNTQTGHIQRLVLGAHYNLGSTKSSLSISEHLGVTSH